MLCSICRGFVSAEQQSQVWSILSAVMVDAVSVLCHPLEQSYSSIQPCLDMLYHSHAGLWKRCWEMNLPWFWALHWYWDGLYFALQLWLSVCCHQAYACRHLSAELYCIHPINSCLMFWLDVTTSVLRWECYAGICLTWSLDPCVVYCRCRLTEWLCHVQGCVEICYITLQCLLFVMIVYWMCWFQIDAGQSHCNLVQNVYAAANPDDAVSQDHCLSSMKCQHTKIAGQLQKMHTCWPSCLCTDVCAVWCSSRVMCMQYTACICVMLGVSSIVLLQTGTALSAIWLSDCVKCRNFMIWLNHIMLY